MTGTLTIKSYSNQAIQAELVDLLYKQAKPAIWASLIVATLLTAVLSHQISSVALFSWYGFMIGITLGRYTIIKMYFNKKLPITSEKTRIFKQLFILSVAMSSIAWTFIGTLLMPHSVVYQTLIVCVLAGLSGGAIPFFAASRMASAVYIIPMLLPFSVGLFAEGDVPHQLLGAFTLIYLVLLLLSSFRTHRAIYDAIQLKFQNISLIENLSCAKKEMEVINNNLESEIIDRKMAEKRLRESEEQYRLVTDALPVLISYIDPELNYLYNNKAHESWLGKELSEITGTPVKEVMGSAAYEIFLDHHEKLKDKPIQYETLMQFGNNDERYVSVTLIPHIKENKIHGLFSLISDMTPRINYLATHDALTDLPNRSLFTARFSQALKRAQRHHYQVALLFLDLDHFKDVNDTLGHDVGDQLLIKVSERISGCIRNIDTVARQGGDEFIILLEDVMTKQIVNVANRIIEACRLPFDLDGKEIFITTSIGISIHPEDGEDMQILLKNADMAIYRAKEKGRNTFEFYTEELNNKLVKKHTIETKLRSALEKDELLLYYQPIVDVKETQICGLESLIRWQHPELGIVPPNDFIPIAEEVGLILPMGEWVFRTACLQKLMWAKNGYLPLHSRTSINISARQFREDHLIDMISSVLKDTGLSGEYLALELTETLIMQDMDHSIRIIKKLKDLGIAISIDDFGTGYSSFNYLRKFPLDTIKIDGSFIADVATNKDDASIVTAIIAMAHSLKMKVIAERVETIEQYDFLQNQGCDEVQGYLISKPLSAVTLTAFLQENFSLKQLLEAARSAYVSSTH
jgi:diguanylate cyclase (GGDEF)-like protein/PAS domain S-box-containing protein